MRSFQHKWQAALDLPHPSPIIIPAKALSGTRKGEKPQSQYSQLLKGCPRCTSPRSTQPTSTPVPRTPSVVHTGCYKLTQLYVLGQTWLWFMTKPKDKANDYKNCIFPIWWHSVPSAPRLWNSPIYFASFLELLLLDTDPSSICCPFIPPDVSSFWHFTLERIVKWLTP